MTARMSAARITSLNVKLSLEFIQATRTWIDEDLISALLVAGVVSANVEPSHQKPEELRRFPELGSVPDETKRPVNAMSVALSLGIPRETARVKLAALLERGILEKTNGGVIIRTEVITSEPFLCAMRSFLQAVSDFINGLAALEVCGVLAGDRMASPPWSVGGVATRLATAHVLRTIDFARELNPQLSLTTHYLLLSLFHLTDSASQLSQDVADDSILPSGTNGISRPATVAELSRFTRLPDETVRRQVIRLETLGIAVRRHGGREIVLEDPGFGSRSSDFENRTMASTRQVVWKLFYAGVIVRGKAHGLTLNVLER